MLYQAIPYRVGLPAAFCEPTSLFMWHRGRYEKQPLQLKMSYKWRGFRSIDKIGKRASRSGKTLKINVLIDDRLYRKLFILAP